MGKDSSTKQAASKPLVPLSVPEIGGNEWLYIKECLDTGWVSSVGSYVDRFEEMIAATCGVAHAVATASGTAALHVALQLAGVGPDDEVLLPTLTFIAPANTIRYLGARPVIMDVDPRYWQMDPQKVHDFLTTECAYHDGKLHNKVSGRQVKAILPVHLLGHPCDMDPLVELAEQFELKIIADATESLGSTYRGRPTGGIGTLGCLSFNGNKIITTGGGGAIITNSESLAKRARYLTTQAKDDPFEYIHHEIGYNYRLTNIQAAMGVAQLERLPSYVAAKRKTTETYNSHFSHVPGLTLPEEAQWARSNCWLYAVLVSPQTFGESSRQLSRRLKAESIETRPFWRPVHRQVPFLDCQSYKIEVADRLYEQGISLPCSVGLTREQQDRVVTEILALRGVSTANQEGSSTSAV
ncbi:MAG TPA: LegC family aminotransferase [Verrucomicrobiae bacterium]|jgi:perosamine synthetase|nr:LegC family aminotransferase [Verrucomicrobiae bacterium]